MEEVAVRAIDLASRVHEVLAVQAVAFGLSNDEVAIRTQVVLRHAAYPGVRALGAFPPGGELVGFTYGMPNSREHWWSSVIEPYLVRAGNDEWLDDAFGVTELHVRPDFQGRGLGRALITRLTDGVPQHRSILSAVEGPSRARRLYHSLGYVDLAHSVRFLSAPTLYVVMGAPLPLRGPRPAFPGDTTAG
ncbi:acetyltransferase [Wenjunlia vitaminophila]|uniref:Acetyltransferase n=1 Tax=Wenjunlia vitaminophila TaxID=76728 RepID=A0A0T6LYC5_WENVI|nr:GNAT family N-acetyltransferase [Wenjunlia vitaminophila]KRV51032.1 acetyltransferase [Wenjunlia vitaminophila]